MGQTLQIRRPKIAPRAKNNLFNSQNLLTCRKTREANREAPVKPSPIEWLFRLLIAGIAGIAAALMR